MWQLRQPGPATFERHQVAAPSDADVGPDQVLLRFLAGSICGSDIPKFLGQTDPTSPSTGEPGVPLHEFVGRVEASRSDRFAPGDRVVGNIAGACGLAELVVNPAPYVHPVDERLTDVGATVVQPLATVLNALSNVSDVAGRTVAVLGLGPIGLLFTQVLKARGAAWVIGVDRVDRSDVARAFGIDEVATADVRTWAAAPTGSTRPSLVVDAIGHGQQHVADAVDALAYGGELLVFGLPDEHYVFPMLTFYRKALRMWSGATRDWSRFLADAHEHVLRHDVLTEAYVTHTMSVFDAQEAYRVYATPAVGRLKVALTVPG
ncbi:MAG: zinc-dependent alcohol dehydrogenase [Nocardioidaceae bacterium]